ncbi:MAG: glycoside hydrolase family 15 [Actinobacteria bacterium HGW-Actinobacteria-4]|nr:MAG: glycoside hydrolase family 15 [Actinobacteria bacterium HGW-Actinobacteria-4]
MPSAAPVTLDHLVNHSRALITSLQTAEGAYPASPEFSAYRGYCWFRDGSFIADAMSSWNDVASAEQFFDWCAAAIITVEDDVNRVVAAQAAGRPVPDEEMLPTRFTFDHQRGSHDWWDFQLDGYGTWLWALGAHVARHGSAVAPYSQAIKLTVAYLVSSWHRPCYDWWEEHVEQRHVSTLGCVAAGLSAAIRLNVLDDELASQAEATASEITHLIRTQGVHDGHLVKWIGSTDVDASLASLIEPLQVIDANDPIAIATIVAIEEMLVHDGGTHRYLGDTFYGGGLWPLLSCFLGLAHHAQGNEHAAHYYERWAASTVTAQLDMPEQVGTHLLDPSHLREWTDRWGTVATPLLWSHAMHLRLAKELSC